MSVDSFLRFTPVAEHVFQVRRNGTTIAEVALDRRDDQYKVIPHGFAFTADTLDSIAAFMRQLDKPTQGVSLRPDFPAPRCVR